ncbi:hypothetical protein DEU56DRAFT_916031 [Suillus clintonianus]|uniref:uncharacterized protein n=1 Tax=Suillus clintonianus TaxID=1904413 RepID=UPI001B886A90|nr:uncharacterized protein DEU56DRAFT_916031 [Suillus clintonianus]KAG2126515.1 hypothetical protein DEU56DRAFT_916031 [Suillus clintonianus]
MISPSTIIAAVPAALVVDGNDGNGTDDLPAAPIADDTGDNGTDSLIALLAQMNITGQEVSDVTSKIHDAVQNVLVAAISAISAVSTTSASTPLVPALTPSTTSTSAPLIPALPALTPVVNYDVPAADATGPFYWVTRGRRIGVFSTWQQTSSHVIGVSRASFSKVRSVAEGIQLMKEAIGRGETEVLT